MRLRKRKRSGVEQKFERLAKSRVKVNRRLSLQHNDNTWPAEKDEQVWHPFGMMVSLFALDLNHHVNFKADRLFEMSMQRRLSDETESGNELRNQGRTRNELLIGHN